MLCRLAQLCSSPTMRSAILDRTKYVVFESSLVTSNSIWPTTTNASKHKLTSQSGERDSAYCLASPT